MYIHVWSTDDGKLLKRVTNDIYASRIAWNPKGTADFMVITWSHHSSNLIIWGSQTPFIGTLTVSLICALQFFIIYKQDKRMSCIAMLPSSVALLNTQT